MHELSLAIAPQNWIIFSGRKNDKRFTPLKNKVLERDQHTCQYCGFQAMQHQEVVNLDQDYRNNRMSNLITACVFCTQSCFLDVAGLSYGGGKLVYLPDMTQAELNSFCHVIFCAMMNRTSYLNSAQTVYRNLRLQSQFIEKKFGASTSSPGTFCRLVLNQKQFDDERLKEIFKDIRLLPSYAKFKPQLSDWAKAAVEELAEEA